MYWHSGFMRKILPLSIIVLLLSGCYSQVQVASHWIKKNANKASGGCTSEGYMKTGNPYKIFGIKYYPKKSSYGYDETGIASWYGKDFHAKASANGECYDMYAMTAAHKTLPLPTTVKVTNLKNGRSVILKVNDRGPYADNRIIDLSYAAAKKLDMDRDGIQKVRVQAISGPYHKPGGATAEEVRQSRNASPSERRRLHDRISKSTTPAPTRVSNSSSNSGGYSLTNRALDGVSASVNHVKNIKIGGVDVGTRISQHVSLKNIKDALPKRKSGGFTDRISNKSDTTAPQPSTEQTTQNTTPAATTGSYLQFGSYSQHANAMQRWNTITQTFPKAQLQTVQINGIPMHRIRTGPFTTNEEVTTALAKARTAGFTDVAIIE